MKKYLIFSLIIFVLIITLACSTSSNISKVGEVPSTKSDSESNAVAKIPETKTSSQMYKVGDIIQTEKQRIVLNSSQIKGKMIVLNLTIENIGKDEISISSMLLFEVKDSEGQKLELEIFDCPNPSLDGTVLVNDKLKGNICFTILENSQYFRVIYSPEFFSSNSVVWEISGN